MNSEQLNKILEEHKKWVDSNGKDGVWADLLRANLRGADLQGADIDFASWPLWCGSLDIHIDDVQAIQLLYHVVRAVKYSKHTSDNVKSVLLSNDIINLANKFHRVEECGMIEIEDEKEANGKCPICEYEFENCQCYFSGSAHPDRDKRISVVKDHLYLLTEEQLNHLIKLEKFMQTSYSDSEKQKEYEKLIELTNNNQATTHTKSTSYHCFGAMDWILKYPVNEVPCDSICDCQHVKKCLELTNAKRSK